jgi:chromosome segregation ATPase
MSTAAPAQPDFWTRLGSALGRFFGFLLRLVFILLLAVAVGAAVYYGWPWAYRQLIQPVQTHTSQIQELFNRLEGLRSSAADAQTAQSERLTAIETGTDDQRLRLAEAENEVAALQALLAEERGAREALAAQVAGLETGLTAQAAASGDVQSAVDALTPVTEANAAQAARLEGELALTRLENDLLRARLDLVAENFGDARAAMTATLPALMAFVETPGLFSADEQTTLIVRLRAAGSLIDAEPAAALTDLESVWREMERLLIEG